MTNETTDDANPEQVPHPPNNVFALDNPIHRATPEFVLRMATMEVGTMRSVVVLYEGEDSYGFLVSGNVGVPELATSVALLNAELNSRLSNPQKA